VSAILGKLLSLLTTHNLYPHEVFVNLATEHNFLVVTRISHHGLLLSKVIIHL